MVYKVKSEGPILRTIITLYACSLPILGTFFSEDVIYIYFGLSFLLIILTSNIQFEFTIGDSFLLDERLLFRKSLYKKRMDPKEIKQIKFTRIGWKRKGAIIQMEKGFSIHITHYTPDSAIAELMGFAHKYEIPIEKTRDFKILEKWKM